MESLVGLPAGFSSLPLLLCRNPRGKLSRHTGLCFDLTYRPHKLRELLKRKEPALIFVNSMADFFDEHVPDEWRDRVVEAMRDTPHLQYQILTKRPKVMVDYCERREMSDNVWLGVTVELPLYLPRVDLLRKAWGTGPKFISAEPLLADLGRDVEVRLAGHGEVLMIGGDKRCIIL